ncbi:MAG: hypothetical protein QF437_29160 [Planctomycetota bacterium]|nr:hypothetical protein [Planctomycetota bacterium]
MTTRELDTRSAALDSPTPSDLRHRPARDVPGQVIQLGQGRATISVSVTTAVAAKGDSVSVTNVNGVRTITVKEKERTVEIREQQGDALELLITKTAGGKTKTEKIEAKNADDLKKRHPKLYALYKKHAGK